MRLSHRIRAAWRYFRSLGQPSPRRDNSRSKADTTAALRRSLNVRRQGELAVAEALFPDNHAARAGRKARAG
jgi:hypothetical protein